MDSEEDDPHDVTPGRDIVYGSLRGDIAWLDRREEMQAEREESLRLNWKYDCEQRTEVDLGKIRLTFAFVFQMGKQDDGPSNHKRELKRQWEAADQIPLEAWQLAHRMWKADFHVTHHFSPSGDRLTILVGLPYKILVEEATQMRIKMRLRRTKGVAHFNPHLVERYAVGSEKTTGYLGGSPFTSAHRQGLCLRRLKKHARVNPNDLLTRRAHKANELTKLRTQFNLRHAIRGRHLQHLMEHFGAFRPFASKIFGDTVIRTRDVVASDPWMLIAPPEVLSDEVRRSAAEDSVQYKDVGTVLDALEEWLLGGGQYESFSGTFDDFFPVHDKDVLRHLQERWGSFEF
eukprot:COSAG05_NODE_2502_length_2975_cov_2.805633_1_plen_344_part_10